MFRPQPTRVSLTMDDIMDLDRRLKHRRNTFSKERGAEKKMRPISANPTLMSQRIMGRTVETPSVEASQDTYLERDIRGGDGTPLLRDEDEDVDDDSSTHRRYTNSSSTGATVDPDEDVEERISHDFPTTPSSPSTVEVPAWPLERTSSGTARVATEDPIPPVQDPFPRTVGSPQRRLPQGASPLVNDFLSLPRARSQDTILVNRQRPRIRDGQPTGTAADDTDTSPAADSHEREYDSDSTATGGSSSTVVGRRSTSGHESDSMLLDPTSLITQRRRRVRRHHGQPGQLRFDLGIGQEDSHRTSSRTHDVVEHSFTRMPPFWSPHRESEEYRAVRETASTQAIQSPSTRRHRRDVRPETASQGVPSR